MRHGGGGPEQGGENVHLSIRITNEMQGNKIKKFFTHDLLAHLGKKNQKTLVTFSFCTQSANQKAERLLSESWRTNKRKIL